MRLPTQVSDPEIIMRLTAQVSDPETGYVETVVISTLVDLSNEIIFGKLITITHYIEFQKRGVSHIHSNIWTLTRST